MDKTKNTISLSLEGEKEIDKQLSRLAVWNRHEALLEGMKDGAQIVAKRASELAPRGGVRQGRKKRVPHLRDAMGVVVRRYRSTEMVVGGPIYRPVNGANHAHNVELGHRIGSRKTGKLKELKDGEDRTIGGSGFVKPNPFLEPAINDTRGQVEAAVIRGVIAAVDKALGSG